MPAPFTADADPVVRGQFAPDFDFAGDAGVVLVGEQYRMYHTCYAVDRSGPDICLATSSDGRNWSLVDTGDSNSQGRVLRSDTAAWDAAHETPFAVAMNGETTLFAVGYSPASIGFLSADMVGIAVATSSDVDGAVFAPTQGPLVTPAADGPASHGFTSPSVVVGSDGWTMIATGWCLDAVTCSRANDDKYTVQMLATSMDGTTWSLRPEPVVTDVDLPWARKGIAESQLVLDPDSGLYLLAFQALDDGPHRVGLASAPTPSGPWTFFSEPLLTSDDVGAWANGGIVAPHLLFVDGRVQMWFSGQQNDADGNVETFRIGYAEAERPLLRPSSDGT